MKRFLLFIILFTFPVAVSGKIITTENLLDDSILQDEELIFTESDVCWEEAGDYYVDYFDPKIKTEIRKDIFIRNTEDLKAGLTFIRPTANLEIPGLKAKGYLPYGEKGFFIYGAIYTGYLPYQTLDSYLFCYLAYFENGVMLWEEIFHPERYGTFSNACLTENGIALIGTYDSLEQGKNIIVYEVTSEKQITFQKEIQGGNDDFGLKIFYNRNNFYLVGLTMSDDIDFRFSEGRDIFVGKLTKEKSLSIYPLLREGRDELHDAYYQDGRFYLVSENNLNDKKTLELIVLNENKEFVNFDLTYFGSNNQYLISPLQDKILITFLKNAWELKAMVLDQDLKLKQELKIDFEKPLTDYFLFPGLETYLVFVSGNQSKTLMFARFNPNKNLEVFFEKEMNPLDKVVGIAYNQTSDLFLCLEVDSGKFTISDFKYFRLEESVNETQNCTLKARNIYYNGKSLDKEYLSDNIPENPYGKFQTLYRFSQGDYCFYLADEHYFSANTNIRSGEVYDLGTCVYFNGRGYLNGKEVTSGIKILEAGHYLLEIKAEGEENQAYVFEVAELSEVEENPVKKAKPVVGDFSVKMVPKRDLPYAEVNLKENPVASDFFFPSLLIGISIGTLSGFLFPKLKFRRKENV